MKEVVTSRNQLKISRRVMLSAGAGLGSVSLACGSDPLDLKQGLLLDAHPDYLKGVEDGATITTLRDRSGQGNDLIAIEGAAPVYQASGWDGLPCLDFISPPRWMRSDGRSLIAAMSGSDPQFTLAMLIKPSGNQNPGTLWSFGDPTRAHVLSGTADATLGLKTATSAGGEQDLRGSDFNQYTRAPFHQICVWTLARGHVTIRVDGLELKLDSDAFRLSNFKPTHFALGARLQEEPISVSGGFKLRRVVAYDRELSPDELADVEHGLAAFGRVPKCGLDISALREEPEAWGDDWRFVG